MKDLEQFLVQIGLSEKEAAVYVYLLSVEYANATEISKKAKINRTTVYPVIDYLVEKGLAEEIVKDDKNFVRALSPEKIETYIENQKLKLYEQSKMVKDMVPKFKTIYRGEGERPIVEYYDGKEEIIRSAKEMFTAYEDEALYTIYPRDEVESNFKDKDLTPIKNARLEKGIKVNSIYTYSKGEYQSENSMNRKRIDSSKYKIGAEISVYGKSTRIHIFGKTPGTIFIKSKDVAETIKTLFRLIFDTAK